MSDFSDIFLSKYILKNKGFFAKLLQKKVTRKCSKCSDIFDKQRAASFAFFIT